MAFFLIFTDTTLTPRYFSTCIYMSLPVLVIWLMREDNRAYVKLYLAVLTFCLALSVLKITYSIKINDKNEARRAVCEYLEENGLNRGFTLYDDSNILVELTDGDLSVGAFGTDLQGFFLWSTPQRFYDEG